MKKEKYFVYILECLNGAYYTGYTKNLERRFAEHLTGSAKCKFTRSFPPKKVAAYWVVETIALALSLEKRIKELEKPAKTALVDNPKNIKKLLTHEELDLVKINPFH